MKKNIKIIAGVLIILVVLAGLYFRSRQPLYIGFGGGLSDQWSQLSVEARNGFLQAVEDINAEGGINGRKIIPLVMDDQNDNSISHELLAQMKEKEVKFFVGFTVSSMTPSVEMFMENSDILIMSPTMSTTILTGKDDNFFRVCNANEEEARHILKMLEADDAKEATLLYDMSNAQYSTTISEIVVEKSKEQGFIVTYEEGFNSRSSDYGELVKRLERIETNHIVIIASGVDTAEIAQRLRISGNESLLYASAWATTNELLENGGTSVENMRVNGLTDIASTNERYLDYRDTVMANYGDEPIFPQIFGYESLYLLKEAMEISGSVEPDKVKAALIKQGTFEGLQQEISFDEFGDAHREYFTYIIKDGKFTTTK